MVPPAIHWTNRVSCRSKREASVTRVVDHVLHTRAHTWIEFLRRSGRAVGTIPLLQMYVCSRGA